MKKALLIDANALIHRAWHALPPMTSPKGKLVNAVYGFTSVLIKVLAAERPDLLAVCWDTPEPTFRHIKLETYKAHREEQPEDFYNQIPEAKRIVECMGGTNVELPGFEADDLLGTLSVKASEDGYKVTILTGDKDAFQLVNDNVSVLAFKKGVSETVTYTPESMVQILGLKPEQIVDYKAMRGDASDNIPGIRGIGEVTATELLQRFGDLKNIFKAAHDPKSEMAKGVRAKLLDGENTAQELLPIVTIVTDAPLKVALSKFARQPVDEEKVLTLFSELGFKSLVSRVFNVKTEQVQNNEPITSTKPIEFKTKKKAEKKVLSKKSQGIEFISAKGKDDIADIIECAKKQGGLMAHLPQATQTSLFGDNEVLYLGTETRAVTLSNEILNHKGCRELLAQAFADETIKKNGHGLKKFWHWADEKGFEFNGFGFDVELAAYLLAAGERGHDLPTVAGMYLQRSVDEQDQKQVYQAMVDLVPVLMKQLEETKSLRVFQTIEIPLIPVLAEMEKEGIKIDVQYLTELSKELSRNKQSLEKKMCEMAGEAFNPLSTKQLGHVLFDVLKISVKGIKRGKTGISTAASELEKMHGAHPIIELIEQYRELSKMLSTYVDALPRLADAQGRVHTTFNQAVTATGRLSSSDPNLQNIPIRSEMGRKVRRSFVAKQGCLLVSCDYSQIELRIAAALAKDKTMLEAFERGLDIHSATAARIWNKELKDVAKDERRVAKAINFGLIFGQGPQGLARTADISVAEAKDFIDRYFLAFSGIQEWMSWAKAFASQQGYVETLFGRRRPLPEINSPLQQVRAAAERMAINMPVQGTEADLMKLAMIKVAQVLPQVCPEAKMLLQVHDELVFEVPKKDATRLGEAMADVMQNVEKIGCPIVVDAKVGENWEEMEKI